MEDMAKKWTEEEVTNLVNMFKNKMTCKDMGNVLDRTQNSVIAKLNKLGYKTDGGRRPYKYNVGQEVFNIKIIKQERRVKCKEGHTSKGYVVLIDNEVETFIWESNLNKITKPYKRTNIINKTNWLYSEKWMFDFVKNPEDLKRVSKYSNDPIDCHCYYCDYSTTFTASYLYSKGFNCSVCGDKGSFNNRFMKSILLNNQETFEDEKTFEECRSRRKLPFDFYLPNRNLIIEMDGRQHKEEVDYFGDFERTVTHDKIKEEFCISKGIDLIRIDCSSDDKDVIADNIKKSILGEFLTISNDSFVKSRKNPQNSRLVEMYTQKYPMKEIEKEFGIEESAIRKRLRRLGVTIRPQKRKVRCVTTGEEFESLRKAGDWCNCKSTGNISEVCKPNSTKKFAGKHPVTGEKLTWEYVD